MHRIIVQFAALCMLLGLSGESMATAVNVPERLHELSSQEHSSDLIVGIAKTKYPRTLIGVPNTRTVIRNMNAVSLIPKKAPQQSADNNGDDTVFDLQNKQPLKANKSIQ